MVRYKFAEKNRMISGFELVLGALLLLILASQQLFSQSAEELKQSVIKAAEALRPQIDDISMTLWNYSETALQEYKSAEFLIGQLETAGFTIERGVAEMPTVPPIPGMGVVH